MEAGEQEKIEHLSKNDQVTFESAVEGDKSQTTFQHIFSTQGNNFNLFLKRKENNQEDRGNFHQYDLLALPPPNIGQ